MLRPEQNTFATQTGPGTPMGEMFRRYWIPAMHADELPENECPPVRIKLLWARLLAWRDTQGRLALTDEFCAHRGVSLWFGRNEHNGLRCPYHGWKYDHTGQCIEVPSEPSESGFCNKIKLKSYPLIERGGILWAYMGPPELQPPFPEFEWSTLAAAHCYNTKRLQECDYLQSMEGGIDSSHVSFLHSGDKQREPLHRGAAERRGGLLLLAHHPVDHALVHHGAALRPQRAQRARLGADRRRNLLYLDLHLPSDAALVGHGDRRHEKGRRHPCAAHSRHVPADHQQGQRLHDGPRGAEARRDLLRRARHRHAGRLGAGKHGADPGPLQGKSRVHRQRHHHGAAPP